MAFLESLNEIQLKLNDNSSNNLLLSQGVKDSEKKFFDLLNESKKEDIRKDYNSQKEKMESCVKKILLSINTRLKNNEEVDCDKYVKSIFQTFPTKLLINISTEELLPEISKLIENMKYPLIAESIIIELGSAVNNNETPYFISKRRPSSASISFFPIKNLDAQKIQSLCKSKGKEMILWLDYMIHAIHIDNRADSDGIRKNLRNEYTQLIFNKFPYDLWKNLKDNKQNYSDETYKRINLFYITKYIARLALIKDPYFISKEENLAGVVIVSSNLAIIKNLSKQDIEEMNTNNPDIVKVWLDYMLKAIYNDSKDDTKNERANLREEYIQQILDKVSDNQLEEINTEYSLESQVLKPIIDRQTFLFEQKHHGDENEVEMTKLVDNPDKKNKDNIDDTGRTKFLDVEKYLSGVEPESEPKKSPRKK